MARRVSDPLARMARRMERRPDGCWTIGPLDQYTSVLDHGRSRPGHVIVYEQVNHVVCDGYHVHHMCENPGCINPDHLARLTSLQHKETHQFGHPDFLGLVGDKVRASTDHAKVVAWMTAAGTLTKPRECYTPWLYGPESLSEYEPTKYVA